ncbi:hypothetical protein E7L52_22525, partial [Bacillus paralicheniformis]
WIMSRYEQSQIPVAHPPAPQEGAAYVMAPPPVGYPARDGGETKSENQAPVQTQSRGDGFWKGCCAALCCCCVLDACF